MKQPKIKITNLRGKDYGIRRIMQMQWDKNGVLRLIQVDFIQENNSNDLLPFYNHENTGEFISVNGNLKGIIIL